MSKEIEHWFSSNKDYNSGVELYKKHAAEKTMLFLFELGENEYSREQLISELEKLKPVEKPKQSAEPKQKRKYDVDELPNELKERHKRITEFFAEAKHIHAQLRYFNDINREKACFRILHLDEKIDSEYEHINAYLENGVIIENEAKEVDFHSLYINMILDFKNHPKYISKYKNDPNKQDEVKARVERVQYIQDVIDNGRII